MEAKCKSCKWCKPLDEIHHRTDACLFCYLNGRSRKKDETGCLEYERRLECGRERIPRET